MQNLAASNLQDRSMTVYIAYLADEQAGAPTGVRIVEPPPDTHQAQRGNFYALVDLQGLDDDAVLTERILSAMQRTYYTAKGTQSQVLTDTLHSAQQLVEAEYAKRSTGWRLGVICIGLMSDRLAIAGMGDAFAFVTTDNGSVNVYPHDRLSAAPNLDDPFALWPLHRQKVEFGGALIAGGAEWLDRVSPRTLASAAAFVTPESCQDACFWYSRGAMTVPQLHPPRMRAVRRPRALSSPHPPRPRRTRRVLSSRALRELLRRQKQPRCTPRQLRHRGRLEQERPGLASRQRALPLHRVLAPVPGCQLPSMPPLRS
jgi:hypothetical protein